jgi:hypothetical protein
VGVQNAVARLCVVVAAVVVVVVVVVAAASADGRGWSGLKTPAVCETARVKGEAEAAALWV